MDKQAKEWKLLNALNMRLISLRKRVEYLEEQFRNIDALLRDKESRAVLRLT